MLTIAGSRQSFYVKGILKITWIFEVMRIMHTIDSFPLEKGRLEKRRSGSLNQGCDVVD